MYDFFRFHYKHIHKMAINESLSLSPLYVRGVKSEILVHWFYGYGITSGTCFNYLHIFTTFHFHFKRPRPPPLKPTNGGSVNLSSSSRDEAPSIICEAERGAATTETKHLFFVTLAQLYCT